MRRTRMIAALGVATVLVAGCTSPATTDDVDLRVVVTTTQLGDWARILVGDLPIDVYQVLQPGDNVHEYQPSMTDHRAIARADLVVVNGSGLDSWIESALAAAGFQGVVADTTGTWLPEFAPAYLEAADQRLIAEYGADLSSGHDHSALNPHTWTSVPLAQRQVAELSSVLQGAVPWWAAAIQEHEAAYQAQLTELDAWTRQAIARRPGNEIAGLLTTHPTLYWFSHEYGAVEAGFGLHTQHDAPLGDPHSMAPWAAYDALYERFGDGWNVLVPGSEAERRLQRLVAEELGGRLILEDDGYLVDSLAPSGTFGDTYITSHIHNVGLAAAQSGYVVTAPESLEG